MPTSITATCCGVETMNTAVLESTGRLRNSLSGNSALSYYLMYLPLGNTGSRELAGLLWMLCSQLYYFILKFDGGTACQKSPVPQTVLKWWEHDQSFYRNPQMPALEHGA